MNPEYVRRYRDLYERHWWWRVRERCVLDVIRKWHSPGPADRVLDVGCGDALAFDTLAEFGAVEGVEPDADAVSPENRATGRVHVLPFEEFAPGRRYALITMLDVLEHLDEPAAAVRHAADLLTDDGTLVVTVPAFRCLWTRHDELNQHRTRFTRSTLLPLLASSGMRAVHARYLFQWAFAAKLGVRLWEAMVPGAPAPPGVPPASLNRALHGVTSLEERLGRFMPVPFGNSLLVVAKHAAQGNDAVPIRLPLRPRVAPAADRPFE